MLVKFIEVDTTPSDGRHSVRLKETYINPQHIISVSEDFSLSSTLISETRELGLNENVSFSTLLISEGNNPRLIVVVGTPSQVHHKINKKQVLKG